MNHKSRVRWAVALFAAFCWGGANALDSNTFEVLYSFDDVDFDGAGDDDGDSIAVYYTRSLAVESVAQGSAFVVGSYARGALEESLNDVENAYAGIGLELPIGSGEQDISIGGAVTFDHSVFGGQADNGLGLLGGFHAAFSPRFSLDGHLRQVFMENTDVFELQFGVGIRMTNGGELVVQYRNRDFDVDSGADFDFTSIMIGLRRPI